MSVYSLQSLGLADSHPATDSALPPHVPSLPGETSRTQPTPRSPKGPSISSGWDEQDAGFTLGGCRGRGDPEGAGLCMQPWSQAVPGELSTRPDQGTPAASSPRGPAASVSTLETSEGKARPLAALRVQGSMLEDSVFWEELPTERVPELVQRPAQQPRRLSQGAQLAPLSLGASLPPETSPRASTPFTVEK